MPNKSGPRKRNTTPMAKWLRTVRSMYDLDQLELGQHLGLSRSAIANYETGRPIPIEHVALIRSTFPEAPAPPEESESPLQPLGAVIGDGYLGKIKYAGVVPCSSNWGEPLASEELRPIELKFAGNNRFLCKVQGDSCYPALKQGDLTIWEKDQSPPYGVIVLAERTEDRACTVKVLHYDPQTRENRLMPVNEDHDEPVAEGWMATARLVGVIRQEDGPEETWFWPAGLRPKHLIRDVDQKPIG